MEGTLVIPVGFSIVVLFAIQLALLIMLARKLSQGLVLPEVAPKLLHISMGILASAFPWIFSRPEQVWLVAMLISLGFVAIRQVRFFRLGIGAVIHAKGRKSYGELCFPVAIAGLYTLADGKLLLYLVPLMILTFANSLAALAGVFYGRHSYRSPDGRKSFEGSLVMFVIAMGCVIIALVIDASMTFDKILLIAFNLATVTTLLEAICWRGLDNLVIPVAAFFLLQAYLPLTDTYLAAHALMIFTFAISLLAAQKYGSLEN